MGRARRSTRATEFLGSITYPSTARSSQSPARPKRTPRRVPGTKRPAHTHTLSLNPLCSLKPRFYLFVVPRNFFD